MNAPRVDIILVKYNAPGFESKAIKAVLDATEYPNYSLIAHQNERGTHLSTCWNRLIAASRAKYICLLNTDAVVTPGWLDNLVVVLEQEPDVVAAVPSSNMVHLSQIETPLRRDEMDEEVINAFAASFTDMELCELPSASAMCVVFPRALWEKVGGFDEEYSLYGEDTDFFCRLSTHGRILWHTGVYVHHYGSQSVQRAIEAGELDYEKVRLESAAIFNRKQLKSPTVGESG